MQANCWRSGKSLDLPGKTALELCLWVGSKLELTAKYSASEGGGPGLLLPNDFCICNSRDMVELG